MVVQPPFLLGGVAVLTRADLRFDEARLGLSAAAFFAATAASSIVGGRVAERIGPRAGMLLAGGISTACLIAVSLSTSWAMLTAFMAFGGLGNGFGQPAANLALARGVAGHRQGLAFGIKQSAIPVAGIIAGASLPAVGLVFGWRFAFALPALGFILVITLTPRFAHTRKPTHESRRGDDAALRPLVVIAIGCMLATMTAQSLGVFTVESGVAAGLTPTHAGLLLSGGSLAGIAGRLAAGWLADRREGRHLVAVSWMLGIGSLGCVLLGVSATHAAFAVLGTIIGFSLSWGWPGLLFLAVVRLNPTAPALATGITQTGGALGGVFGPLLFGAVVSRSTYQVGWWATAVLSLLAVGCMLIGRRLLGPPTQRRRKQSWW
ncbi:MAG: MFS transporter [Propionibacteriales bacterium]|nr:MFS transporter [Propionibacteriales bacterium]